MDTLSHARERESPQVQGLPVVAHDPGDEWVAEASESFNQPALTMPGTQPEMQENRGIASCYEKTDGDP